MQSLQVENEAQHQPSSAEGTLSGDDGMERRVFALESFAVETNKELRDIRERLISIEATLPHLATKADLAILRSDMKAEMSTMKSDMKAEMSTMKSDMKAEISTIKSDMKAEISALQSDMKAKISAVESAMTRMESTLIKWLAGFSLVIISVLIASGAFIANMLR